jgi:hypothetical protein
MPPLKQLSSIILISSIHFLHRKFADSDPYQGRYRSIRNSGEKQPPQPGIFDDIAYSLENHGESLDTGADPLVATIFLQKNIASHHMSLIQHIKSC